MILFQLFVVFFKVGLFAIGGAYSFIPLLEKEIVVNHQWLTKPEFLDIIGLVKIFPGAISIKVASYVGYKLAGIPGVLVANMGNFLAPVILVIGAASFYLKYKNNPTLKGSFDMIQVVIFAMLIATAFQMMDVGQLVNVRILFVVIVSFVLFIYTKIDPAFIIIGAGILGSVWKG